MVEVLVIGLESFIGGGTGVVEQANASDIVAQANAAAFLPKGRY